MVRLFADTTAFIDPIASAGAVWFAFFRLQSGVKKTGCRCIAGHPVSVGFRLALDLLEGEGECVGAKCVDKLLLIDGHVHGYGLFA